MNMPTEILVLGTAGSVVALNIANRIVWDWLKNRKNGGNSRKPRFEDTCLIIHEGLRSELKSMDAKLDILIKEK